MARDPTGEAFYLWFKRGGLACGPVHPSDGSAWELATGERVPGNLTEGQLINWIRQRTGSVPCLPGES
jgi:hypothetical protein